MANTASTPSRLTDKSTIQTPREDDSTTASVLGLQTHDFPQLSPMSEIKEGHRARVIAIVNQKGGVGKTTSTINLGAALAESGRRVLLLDFDSQASMTTGLGLKPYQMSEQYGSIWYLLNDPNANMNDYILKTNVPGLDFIRGHQDLAAADARFAGEIAKEHMLRKIIAPLLPYYDDIFIDCSPSLGTLTINALTAADGVLIPMECEFFALLGLQLVKDTILKVQANTNPNLKVIGILATRFDKKTGHSREVLSMIQTQFPSEVLDTLITRSIRFSESTAAGEPITTFASSSPGSMSYRRLARELVARGGVL